MRMVVGYGDGVAVAGADVPPTEEGSYEKVYFDFATLENHALGCSSWTRAGGGMVTACPWGLPPRYRRNRHLILDDHPSERRYTQLRRHRRKHSARQLTFLCCCPHERTMLGADNREDSHQWLEPASLSSVAGQIPSAPALGTSSAGPVFSAAVQDPTHRWHLCGHVFWDVWCQEGRSSSQSNKTQLQGP